MFERFTERARKVVVLSQESARTLKHNYIGTEHLLIGLVNETESLAAKVMRSFGLTPEGVTADLVKAIGEGEEVIAGQIPFTPRCKKVLEMALREALSLGHNYIGTEHILLALLREGEGVGARILNERTVDVARMRNDVLRVLSGPPKPKPAPAVVAADLMKIGDKLQSEASRVAEYLKGEKLPYEIAMAVSEIEAAVSQWTETRRTMGVQRAA